MKLLIDWFEGRKKETDKRHTHTYTHTEMVNCAMDIYDMDPDNMRLGKETIERWGEQYKKRTFQMPSGTGGVDIYSSRTTS